MHISEKVRLVAQGKVTKVEFCSTKENLAKNNEESEKVRLIESAPVTGQN